MDKKTQIIAVAGKGGVGKTSLAGREDPLPAQHP